MEVKSHSLAYLFLEITQKCNLNCLHCGSDCKSEIGAAELTTDSWLKIIDYMHDTFGKQVEFVITGGEPLLHPELLKIGRHIQEKEMRWGMVTNGMVLDNNRMSALVKAGINAITISVDGMEKAHNKLRNSQAAFRKVNEALEAIGQSGIQSKNAVTCVYSDNLGELNQIAELLIAKNITSWRLFRIFPSGRADNNDTVLLSFEQTQDLVNWIKNHKKAYQKRGLNINLSCEGWLPFSQDKQVRDAPFFCRAGINMASILSNGTITGCSNNHHSFYEGNILKDNFAQVWENGFEKFRKRTWLKNTLCAECKHVKHCQGGSIHLWDLKKDRPNFCYVREIK